MKSYCANLVMLVLSIGIVGLFVSACVPDSSSTITKALATGSVSPHALAGPSATTQAKGITMSLHLTPAGPFFLSELIAVDVSLTNQTPTSVQLDGPSQAGPCGSALWAELTGGGPPQYTLPTATTHSCPWMGGTIVGPGHTLTIRQLLPLTSSGHIMLTGATRFLTTAPNPLEGHWPAISLTVDPHIPANRMISLH